MTDEELREKILSFGASDVSFCHIEEGIGNLHGAISIVVRLSDAVVEEIEEEPTHSYFHHYRTVNAMIDQILLKTGLLLQKEGFRYLPVAASQSINKGESRYEARYSHRKVACLSGMGEIGRNNCFLHRKYGARVRLGTIFCDRPMPPAVSVTSGLCTNCNQCVDACPAGALMGNSWYDGCKREEIIDPEICSNHMKKAYQHIGRGAVCGICMRVCPVGQKGKEDEG